MSNNSESNQAPECIICQDIFYQPVTLPCGHSYCRPCIKEGLKNKPLCPTCRNPMIGNPDNLAINFTLQNIIETYHKEQYEQKKKSIEKRISLDNQQNPNQGSRFLGTVRGEQQEQNIEKILLLEQYNFKYLFPKTTVDVELKYLGHFEKLLNQCSDKRVIIQFGKKGQLFAAYSQILQIYNLENISTNQKYIKCEVKILSRLNITDTQDVKVNYSEAINPQSNQPQGQNEQQINENQNQDQQQPVQQNQRIFEDGFTFKVASAKIVEDFKLSEEQQIGIQEHTEFVLQMIDDIIKNNGGLNMTTFELQAFLQKQNFLPFLENGYINNIDRVNEFCWIICGIFNFTLQERERLWDAESVIERLTLIKQFLKKFEKINNITSVFDIKAPGHSDNLTLIIIGLIIGFIFLKYFSQYFNTSTIQHNIYSE